MKIFLNMTVQKISRVLKLSKENTVEIIIGFILLIVGGILYLLNVGELIVVTLIIAAGALVRMMGLYKGSNIKSENHRNGDEI